MKILTSQIWVVRVTALTKEAIAEMESREGKPYFYEVFGSDYNAVQDFINEWNRNDQKKDFLVEVWDMMVKE